MAFSRCLRPASLIRRFSALTYAPPPRIGSVEKLVELPELGKSVGASRALVRSSDLELRAHVLGTNETSALSEDKEIQESNETQLVLLSGERGTGKSTALRATVGSAREAGCVVLYIPKASDWTHGGGFFAAARGEEDSGPSADSAAVRWYDRPTQMMDALRSLLAAHEEQLAGVPVEKAGDARAAAEEAVRLARDADDDWRAMPRRAGMLFSAVVEALAADDKTRFVVAIDEYEALVAPTALGDDRGRRLHASCISAVARHFGRDAVRAFAGRMRNGVVVLAQANYLTRVHVRRSRVLGVTDFPLDEQTRIDARGDAWLADMWRGPADGKKIVQFERFSSQEAEKVVELQGVHMTEVDRRALDRLLTLAGGRADVLEKMSASI